MPPFTSILTLYVLNIFFIYFEYISAHFFDDKMVRGVLTFPQRRQAQKYIINACWWFGAVRNQGISGHDVYFSISEQAREKVKRLGINAFQELVLPVREVLLLERLFHDRLYFEGDPRTVRTRSLYSKQVPSVLDKCSGLPKLWRCLRVFLHTHVPNARPVLGLYLIVCGGIGRFVLLMSTSVGLSQ